MTSGSSVPEAARAAREQRWIDVLTHQQARHAPDWPQRLNWLRAAMALADAEVAAAVTEERATTGRRIEAEHGTCSICAGNGVVAADPPDRTVKRFPELGWAVMRGDEKVGNVWYPRRAMAAAQAEKLNQPLSPLAQDIARTLFGPGGRFAKPSEPSS